MQGEGDEHGRASLAVITRVGADAFGTPKILSQQSGDRTHLFPIFSPDGAWVAFSVGKGGHGDDEAQLHLISSDASASPTSVELVAANRVVSNAMTDVRHHNSQPTLAPPCYLAWISFNSNL